MALTKTQKAREEFKVIIEKYGLKADRFGHYKFICGFTNRTCRIKMQKNNWRLEVLYPASGWIKVGGKYFIDGLGDYDKRLTNCKPA